MNCVGALNEEWNLFQMWCPWGIKEKLDDAYIEYEDYIKIIRMMNALGFRKLSENYSESKFISRRETTERLITEENVEEKYGEKAFVRAFLDNINSENIRKMFLKY